MSLGEKMKQARLEAGLSQRQLCAELITRNMLSQIENGTARPSMDTLQQLALRLNRPMSWFLEEDMASQNQKIMAAARLAFREEKPEQVLQLMKDFCPPDPCFDAEAALLKAEAAMDLAEKVAAEGRTVYARELLQEAWQAGQATPYFRAQQEKRYLLLLAELDITAVKQLPSLDSELLLRAQAALAQKDCSRAVALLEAVIEQDRPRWYCLRGSAAMAQEDYAGAVTWLTRAEAAFPTL